MRKLILGAAAAFLAAVAVPGIASADTGGMVKFTYGDIDQDFDPSKDNVVAFSGVVLTDLNNNWSVQASAATADTDHGFASFSNSQFEVHAIYDFGPVAVGGFTGLFSDGYGDGYWLLGVEAAGDVGPVHVSASVSNADARGSGDDIDNYGVNASMNVMPNLNLYVSGSWSDFGGLNGEVDSWGVGGSYDIPNTDFNVGLGYRSSDTETGLGDMEVIAVSIGWRFGDRVSGYMPGANGLIADSITLY